MFDSSGGEYDQTGIEEGLRMLQHSGAEVEEYAARLIIGQKKKKKGKRSKRPEKPPHPKKAKTL